MSTELNLVGLEALASRIKEAREDEPINEDLYKALILLSKGIRNVRELITVSDEADLTRKNDSQLSRLIYPRASNPPPVAGTERGRTFFNTARGRFQKSFDTFDYYDYPTPESCKLSRTTSQTIADNSFTAITFEDEDFDHFGMADLTAQPTRITIPISGRYFVGGCVAFDDNATGERALRIRLNGSTPISWDERPACATVGVNTVCTISTEYEFAKGDFVVLQVRQNSGGDLDVVSSSNYSIKFYAHRLG